MWILTQPGRAQGFVLFVGGLIVAIAFRFFRTISLRVDWLWLFWVVFGAVATSILGFRPNSCRPALFARLLPVTPGIALEALAWHNASVVWTLLVFIFTLGKMGSANWGKRDTHFPRLRGLLAGTAIGVIIAWAFFAFWPWSRAEVARAIIVAVTSAGAFVVIDLVWILFSSELDDGAKEKFRFSVTLLAVDLPSLAAFGSLWLWLYDKKDAGAYRSAFAFGAVSFQLIASKSVFMLVEGGALDFLRTSPPKQALVSTQQQFAAPGEPASTCPVPGDGPPSGPSEFNTPTKPEVQPTAPSSSS